MSAENSVILRSDMSGYVKSFGRGSDGESKGWIIPSDHSDEARNKIIAYRTVNGDAENSITFSAEKTDPE